MSVTGTFKEPLDRQMMEKVQISNFDGDILMNRKNELGGALLEREQYKYRRWGGRGDYWGTKSSWDQMNHPKDSRDKIIKFL